MDFTEQKVLSSFVGRNDVMIADTIESISEESVKMLDKLAMIPVKILWGVTDAPKKLLSITLFSVFNTFIEPILKLPISKLH